MAVSAYYKSLELTPRFVRARYNLGVGCINIGCYRYVRTRSQLMHGGSEAVEHLLSALVMQERNGSGRADGAAGIWDTLKRAFVLMGRADLVQRADKSGGRDVEAFRGEFEYTRA